MGAHKGPKPPFKGTRDIVGGRIMTLCQQGRRLHSQFFFLITKIENLTLTTFLSVIYCTRRLMCVIVLYLTAEEIYTYIFSK